MALRKEATTERLQFGDDWIVVRKDRTYRDTLEAQRAASSLSLQNRKKKQRDSLQFDMAAFNLKLLTMMIVEWSEKDAEGNMLPINDDTVGQLDNDVAQKCLEVILGAEEEDDEGDDDSPLPNSSTSQSESQEDSTKLGTKKALTGLST